MPIQAEQRAHVQTIIDLAHVLNAGLHKLPASQENFKAQAAIAVLIRVLEEMMGALR